MFNVLLLSEFFVCSHRKLINALKIFLRFELMDCDPDACFRLANEANKKNIKYKDMLLGRVAVVNNFSPHPLYFFLLFCF